MRFKSTNIPDISSIYRVEVGRRLLFSACTRPGNFDVPWFVHSVSGTLHCTSRPSARLHHMAISRHSVFMAW